MKGLIAGALILILAGIVHPMAGAADPGRRTDGPPPPSPPRLRLVRMVGYTYEPAELTVAPGDTVRFVQESAMPHNVEFTQAPDGAKLGEARSGPYLVREGATYDLVIDQRFTSGGYAFHCTPHVTLGMKGTITVR